MKKFHIAISTNKVDESIEEYTKRLGEKPCSFVSGEYALWRTESLNFSIRQDSTCPAGQLRHLGWEDDSATEFTEEKDLNGVTWERFSAELQQKEIEEIWPNNTNKDA